MVKLWYNDDEVADFHPLVEGVLQLILRESGFETEYEVKHHPSLPGSTKIPDFAIIKRRSQRTVFILEVKRTERDVDSQRHWNQTRGYVRDLTSGWEPGHRYFAVTNIEKTISFADRDGPDIACILSGNPIEAGHFDPTTHEADDVIESFRAQIKALVVDAVTNNSPEWSDAWSPIVGSFVTNLKSSISSLLDHESEELSKEIGTYELLRIFFYHFIGSFYTHEHSTNARYFRGGRINNNYNATYNEMRNNYARVLELDFKQIFSESPLEEARITPDRLNIILNYINNFTETLMEYIDEAIKQNHSPEYFFDLITDHIYEHNELHNAGKVMSDTELAGLLAELTIESSDNNIIDPGSGDGALLDAAYDKLKRLKSGTSFSHQNILNQLSGIEIDPFLTQLSTFRLVMKSPHEVTEETEAGIVSGDIFNNQRPGLYDVVLMNPPFLRNEESINSLSGPSAVEMVRAIRSTSIEPFVLNASQPNLYFYFLNYAAHYLKDNGKMGIILMSKFMNNKDAVCLKEFLLDKVESVITYPKNFFKGFRVTTSIVILSNNASSDSVKFLNIRSESLISNPEKVKDLLSNNNTIIEPLYSLRVVNRNNLNPEDNWRVYLIDPEDRYGRLTQSDAFANLSDLFNEVKRGGAGNSGGSDLIFPSRTSQLEIVQNTPEEYLCYGLRNNRLRTKSFILDSSALKEQPALHFPSSYDTGYDYGYNSELNDPFFEQVYKDASVNYEKWPAILNQTISSRINSQIIIPRADREKHVVYYNSTDRPIVLSTNFFSVSGFHSESSVEQSKQIKFISAYLISSFSQIQFELLSNDQEGMRKLEGFMINKLRVINPAKFSEAIIDEVVKEFEQLSNNNVTFSGLEGITSPREQLDLAIARALISIGMSKFTDPEKLMRFAQVFLAELVEGRVS